MALGRLGTLTVEADVVNTIVASILWLIRLARINDCHIGSTTALGVLDDSTGRLARRTVLAARSIGHGVVKLEITVKFGGNLKLANRSLLYTLVLITANFRAVVPVIGSLASDALGLEASSSNRVPLAEFLRALVPSVCETLIAAEVSNVQVTPVEPLCHVRCTLIVRVVGRSV